MLRSYSTYRQLQDNGGYPLRLVHIAVHANFAILCTKMRFRMCECDIRVGTTPTQVHAKFRGNQLKIAFTVLTNIQTYIHQTPVDCIQVLPLYFILSSLFQTHLNVLLFLPSSPASTSLANCLHTSSCSYPILLPLPVP